MATQDQRRAATWSRILAAATSLFESKPFDDVSMEDVAQTAAVSKGAIYHYAASKAALFLDVFKARQKVLAEAVVLAAAEQVTPFTQLTVGCRVYLEGCTDDGACRVLLIEGPRVLGWDVWRELDEQCFLSLVRTILDSIDANRPNDLIAHLLIGAVDEAAVVIAKSADRRTALQSAVIEIDRILDALAGVP
jgi:AcrR family transcriptional regulator